MVKKEQTLSEKIIRIMNAPEGKGILFCNVLSIMKFIEDFKGECKSWQKEIAEYKKKHWTASHVTDTNLLNLFNRLDKLAGERLIK